MICGVLQKKNYCSIGSKWERANWPISITSFILLIIQIMLNMIKAWIKWWYKSLIITENKINNHFFRSNPKTHKFSQFSHFAHSLFSSIHQEFTKAFASSLLILHLQVVRDFCLWQLEQESSKNSNCCNKELPWQLAISTDSGIVELSCTLHQPPTTLYTICFHQLRPNKRGFHSCISKR